MAHMCYNPEATLAIAATEEKDQVKAEERSSLEPYYQNLPARYTIVCMREMPDITWSHTAIMYKN